MGDSDSIENANVNLGDQKRIRQFRLSRWREREREGGGGLEEGFASERGKRTTSASVRERWKMSLRFGGIPASCMKFPLVRTMGTFVA